jgi:hypothetical protein
MEDDRYTELTKDSVNAIQDNCESLVTVKTTQLVWGFLQPNTRRVDKKLQNATGAKRPMDTNVLALNLALDTNVPYGILL